MKKIFFKKGIVVGTLFCYGYNVCSEKTPDRRKSIAVGKILREHSGSDMRDERNLSGPEARLDRQVKTLDAKIDTVLIAIDTLKLTLERVLRKQDKCLHKLRERGGASADAGEQRRERSTDGLKEQVQQAAIMNVLSGKEPHAQWKEPEGKEQDPPGSDRIVWF